MRDYGNAYETARKGQDLFNKRRGNGGCPGDLMFKQELDPRVPRCTRLAYDITPDWCGDDLAYGTIAHTMRCNWLRPIWACRFHSTVACDPLDLLFSLDSAVLSRDDAVGIPTKSHADGAFSARRMKGVVLAASAASAAWIFQQRTEVYHSMFFLPQASGAFDREARQG